MAYGCAFRTSSFCCVPFISASCRCHKSITTQQQKDCIDRPLLSRNDKKMIEVANIRAALKKTGYELSDDDMRDYLESMLQEEDTYDDLEGLMDTLQSFTECNDRQVVETLVDTLAKEVVRGHNNNAVNDAAPASTVRQQQQQQRQTETTRIPTPDDDASSDSSSSPVEGEQPPSTQKASNDSPTSTSPKSHKAARKEKRQQRKQQKNAANKSKNPHKKDADLHDGDNLCHVVSKMNAQSAHELNEMDDYSSAWEEVKNSDSAAVWGGRGFGGRGVNRGLGQYKGKDAVVNQLTLSYGGRDLLHETHLAIVHGHRYGLMGPNGVGKSTLLRRIATQKVPGWPLHLSVQMVEQEVLGNPKSAVECMQEISQAGRANQQQEELKEEIAELEAILEDETTADPQNIEDAANRLSELYDQLEALEKENSNSDNDSSNDGGAFSKLDSRAKTILKGLQFQESMLETPGNLLSGGWRMRLALAQALYSQPDILLLDEPTNHLDQSAIIFLENYLVDNKMTVVVVSHDRHFLDAICTDIIKFEDCKLKYHVGNYSSFQEREEQMWARNCSKADAVSRQEKKAKEFIAKQRSMSNSKHRDDNKQRQAAERQKKLGRIGLFADNGQKFKLLAEGNTKKGGSNRAGHIYGNYTNAAGFQSAFVSNEKHAFGENRQLLTFKFPAAQPLKGGGSDMITMDDCRFRYDGMDSWLLHDMTLNVSYGSRIAIVGKNGAGKSTLLKILSGELKVNGGEFRSHPNLKVAHIAQHHIEQLGDYLEVRPVDYFLEKHHAKNEHEARQFLGQFGLVGPLALQKIGTLSGGQKARLAFATVLYTEPHLLILDEPTNHLDKDSLESLAAAVEKFQGAVVVVSHNQEFMSRCAKEMWTVADGRVKVEVPDGETTTFDDLFDNYKEGLRKELRKK